MKAAELHNVIFPERVDKQPNHKEKLVKTTKSPRAILLERVDKQSNHKEKAVESSKPKVMVILPEKGDKQSRQQWMNTVDPWTSQ